MSRCLNRTLKYEQKIKKIFSGGRETARGNEELERRARAALADEVPAIKGD
jgi:hypothetical protein